MRRVQSFVVVAALMQGCVCLHPVDENPEVDGGRDASVESPVTSFIAPVPLEDIGEFEHSLWRSRPMVSSMPLWRTISWTDDGQMLIDAVGGVVLRDGGYVSAATDEWRQSSYDSAMVEVRWVESNGEWYRYTYPGYVNSTTFGPMRLFRLNRTTGLLELRATVVSSYDGGLWEPPVVSATPLWGDTRWSVFDRVWASGHFSEGQLFVSSSLDNITATPPLEWRIRMRANGVDGDTRLIWGDDCTTPACPPTVVRFRGADVTSSVIDAGFCSAPYLRGDAPITLGCASDGGHDVWIADQTGERIIGHDESPPNLPAQFYGLFLVQLHPLRQLYQYQNDAGAFMFGSCNSERCVELMATSAAPLNAGVDDAGALYVADYILDAGVRVTRFAPGAW